MCNDDDDDDDKFTWALSHMNNDCNVIHLTNPTDSNMTRVVKFHTKEKLSEKPKLCEDKV